MDATHKLSFPGMPTPDNNPPGCFSEGYHIVVKSLLFRALNLQWSFGQIPIQPTIS